MQLKPWTEVAIPHSDVLKGTFQDAEFAADLSRVREWRALPEYSDPVQFFERTFITEGMRLLLDGVVRRLNSRGGDPVVQLQTAFGGGKTHTMLAVYHLARGHISAANLRGIPKILDAAGISELPWPGWWSSTATGSVLLSRGETVIPRSTACGVRWPGNWAALTAMRWWPSLMSKAHHPARKYW